MKNKMKNKVKNKMKNKMRNEYAMRMNEADGNVGKVLWVCLVAACVCLGPVRAAADTVLTDADVNALYRTATKAYASVHDPSVVSDGQGSYYIFGSHNAIARTSDFRSWTGVAAHALYGRRNANGSVTTVGYNDAFHSHLSTTVPVRRGDSVTEAPFAGYDAAAWSCAVPSTDGKAWTVDGNMWAPDVIWNVAMQQWCMYLSLNGPRWNSVIILLTADHIEGPYVYRGPVVYSGFRSATDAKISWHLTDLELALGEQKTLPSRYNLGDRWGDYMPHAIDPCVFYDADGQLWMSYGSWSGGIFILQLDEATGLRDYTVSYPLTTDGSGHPLSDPYFGRQIAGGYYVSGEGSYICRVGDSYRLFVTYGGLEAAGGYTMRTFSSERPDGPYTDNQGESAIFSRYLLNYGSGDACQRGNLLVGAFGGWGFQSRGEVAQGHNSAIVDERGRALLVYHTRFDAGGEGFQNRVHQLFTSEEGWLLAAPMEFNGETVTDDSIAHHQPYTLEQMAGEYSLLIHKFGLDQKALATARPRTVVLEADGRVTGDYTGTWQLTQGTGYIHLTLGSATYSGVVVRQTVDGSTLGAIGIAAAQKTGPVLWAYKVLPPYAVAYNARTITPPVASGAAVSTHIDLTTPTRFGAVCQWQSSVPSVISNEGLYSPADTLTAVTLTMQIKAADCLYEKKFNVRASKADSLPGDCLSGIVAYYDFDSKPIANAYDEAQVGTLAKMSSGTMASLVKQGGRVGQVLSVASGTNAAGTGGYIRMPNPVAGRTDLGGITVSAWMKRADAGDLWGTAWAFTSSMPNLAIRQQRFFLTLGTYVGFTNQTDTFAINYPRTANTTIAQGEWKLVTVTVDSAAVNIYVNGVKRATKFASTAGTTMGDFDMKHVFAMLGEAKYMALGTGNGVAGAEACYDDLLVWDRALTYEDVRQLYALERRVTDFGPQGTNGMAPVLEDTAPADDAILRAPGYQIPYGSYILQVSPGRKEMRKY